MKIVKLEDIKDKFDQFLEQAQDDDILVTKGGKVKGMICALSDEDLEDYLIENDPRFMKIIETRRERYKREGGIPLDQLARELGIA